MYVWWKLNPTLVAIVTIKIAYECIHQSIYDHEGARMVGVASGTEIELVIKVKVCTKQLGTIHTDKYNFT